MVPSLISDSNLAVLFYPLDLLNLTPGRKRQRKKFSWCTMGPAFSFLSCLFICADIRDEDG